MVQIGQNMIHGSALYRCPGLLGSLRTMEFLSSGSVPPTPSLFQEHLDTPSQPAERLHIRDVARDDAPDLHNLGRSFCATHAQFSRFFFSFFFFCFSIATFRVFVPRMNKSTPVLGQCPIQSTNKRWSSLISVAIVATRPPELSVSLCLED